MWFGHAHCCCNPLPPAARALPSATAPPVYCTVVALHLLCCTTEAAQWTAAAVAEGRVRAAAGGEGWQQQCGERKGLTPPLYTSAPVSKCCTGAVSSTALHLLCPPAPLLLNALARVATCAGPLLWRVFTGVDPNSLRMPYTRPFPPYNMSLMLTQRADCDGPSL
jgi:hypothetical protein